MKALATAILTDKLGRGVDEDCDGQLDAFQAIVISTSERVRTVNYYVFRYLLVY